ncbi:MAG: TolC family protein [Saprospiraceae bacterium]|nr:TolC family protein [Saprospiraceae bacterium]
MKRFNLLILFLHTFISAQTTLSLKEAVRLALESNYQIRIAQIDQRIAEINNRWSNAGAYPELNISANPNVVSNSIDQRFVNGTEINRKNAISRNINANIQLNYNILNGFNVFTTKEKLETLQQLSEAQLELIILDTYKRCAETYYRIQNLTNNLFNLEAQRKVAIEREQLEEKKFQLGKTGKTSYLQATLDRQDIDILISKQTNAIQESKDELHHFLHISASDKVFLSDSLNAGILIQKNPQTKNSLPKKILNLQSKIKNLEYDEIKRQRLPNLNLFADYRYNRSNNQAGFNLFSQAYGPATGLQIMVPLYDGGRATRQLNTNKLEAEKIQVESEDYDRELNYQLTLQDNRFKHYSNIYSQELQKIPSAEENLQILYKKSELGETNSLEFSQALFRIVEINAAKNDALYNVILSKINENYLNGNVSVIEN